VNHLLDERALQADLVRADRIFRSRASLEAEMLVLRRQLNVLRRKSPKRPTFGSIDRLIFAGLYGVAPNMLSALRSLGQKL
jgi:hypothetical protein